MDNRSCQGIRKRNNEGDEPSDEESVSKRPRNALSELPPQHSTLNVGRDVSGFAQGCANIVASDGSVIVQGHVNEVHVTRRGPPPALENERRPSTFQLKEIYKCYKINRKYFPLECDSIGETFYIPMTEKRGDWPGKKKDPKSITTLDALFNPDREEDDIPRTVLITGDPGYGKTILCEDVFCKWAHGETAIQAFPVKSLVPVYYKLRRLGSQENLDDVLFNVARQGLETNSDDETAKKKLLRLGKSLLIIMDGYNEMKSEGQRKVKDFLLNPVSAFCLASILVTSTSTTNDNDDCFPNLFDKHYVINRTTEEKAKNIINLFEHDNQVKFDRNNFSNVCLTSLSPMAITAFCYFLMKSSSCPGNCIPEKSHDIMYRYIDLIANRQKLRNEFTADKYSSEATLHSLGQMCSYLCCSDVSKSQLRTFLADKFEYAIEMGILNPYTNETREEIYEPVHELLLESLSHKYEEDLQKKLQICSTRGDIQRFLEDTFREFRLVDRYMDVEFHHRGNPKVKAFLSVCNDIFDRPEKLIAFVPEEGNVKMILNSTEPRNLKTKCEIVLGGLPVGSSVVSDLIQSLQSSENLDRFQNVFSASETIGLNQYPCREFNFLFQYSNNSRISEVTNAFSRILKNHFNREGLYVKFVTKSSNEVKSNVYNFVNAIASAVHGNVEATDSASSFFRDTVRLFNSREAVSLVALDCSTGKEQFYLDPHFSSPSDNHFKWSDLEKLEIKIAFH